MLRIRFLSGSLATELENEELHPISESDKPVSAWKEHLAARLKILQVLACRLLQEEMHLEDEAPLTQSHSCRTMVFDAQSAGLTLSQDGEKAWIRASWKPCWPLGGRFRLPGG